MVIRFLTFMVHYLVLIIGTELKIGGKWKMSFENENENSPESL